MSPLLLTIFIISGIDYRANGSLQLKVIKVDWNIDSLIFIKVTAGPFFSPSANDEAIDQRHASKQPSSQAAAGIKNRGSEEGRKEAKKRLAWWTLMGLGLILQSITWVIPVHWLIPLVWSRPSHYRSQRNRRWCLPSLWPQMLSCDCASGLGWMRGKKLPAEWMSEIETSMKNRGACVTVEGELPQWDQRLLSWWKD